MNDSSVTGYVELFESTNIPEIKIAISGNIYSGKTKIAAKIAHMLLEEYAYPLRVISGDGDFLTAYAKANGVEANIQNTIHRNPRSNGVLKPVKITIIDINDQPTDVEMKPHYHQLTLW